ncbi:hypothetical protein ABID82_002264 [Methylobacterium sp. PvP062]
MHSSFRAVDDDMTARAIQFPVARRLVGAAMTTDEIISGAPAQAAAKARGNAMAKRRAVGGFVLAHNDNRPDGGGRGRNEGDPGLHGRDQGGQLGDSRAALQEHRTAIQILRMGADRVGHAALAVASALAAQVRQVIRARRKGERVIGGDPGRGGQGG